MLSLNSLMMINRVRWFLVSLVWNECNFEQNIILLGICSDTRVPVGKAIFVFFFCVIASHVFVGF